MFLIFACIVTGIILAFIGACRQEEPKRYFIIGFVLNALWAFLPLIALAIAIF